LLLVDRIDIIQQLLFSHNCPAHILFVVLHVVYVIYMFPADNRPVPEKLLLLLMQLKQTLAVEVLVVVVVVVFK